MLNWFKRHVLGYIDTSITCQQGHTFAMRVFRGEVSRLVPCPKCLLGADKPVIQAIPPS